MKIFSTNLRSQTVRSGELQFWEKVHLPPPVMFQVSHVTCQVSHFMCLVSHVPCHMLSTGPTPSSCSTAPATPGLLISKLPRADNKALCLRTSFPKLAKFLGNAVVQFIWVVSQMWNFCLTNPSYTNIKIYFYDTEGFLECSRDIQWNIARALGPRLYITVYPSSRHKTDNVNLKRKLVVLAFLGGQYWKSWFSILPLRLGLYFPVLPSIQSNTGPYRPS